MIGRGATLPPGGTPPAGSIAPSTDRTLFPKSPLRSGQARCHNNEKPLMGSEAQQKNMRRQRSGPCHPGVRLILRHNVAGHLRHVERGLRPSFAWIRVAMRPLLGLRLILAHQQAVDDGHILRCIQLHQGIGDAMARLCVTIALPADEHREADHGTGRPPQHTARCGHDLCGAGHGEELILNASLLKRLPAILQHWLHVVAVPQRVDYGDERSSPRPTLE
mmetsp:Transcript_48615/g.104173  ORF Transcript_48615/g.104173 Transcript_48615/m.104173 type:complete len:220 (+) Transcript_48615:76-735(+)